MEPWLQNLLMIAGTVLASSGFWAWLNNRQAKKEAKKNKEDPQSRILMGLARDRIISQSLRYIERGWISDDEYGDLNKYLYEPYVELGGNGTAKRLMDEVKKLPIRHITYDQLSKNDVH